MKILARFAFVVLALTIVASSLASQSTIAEGTMSISPSSVSLEKDSSVTLTVRGSGNGFNTAQINLSYNSSSLAYINYTNAGSSISEVGIFKKTSGNIELTTYSYTAVSGTDMFLASFTFKVLKSSGTDTVSLLSSSALVGNGKRVATPGDASTCVLTFTPPSGAAPSPSPVQGSATNPEPSQQPMTQAPAPNPTPISYSPVITGPSADSTAPVITNLRPAGFLGKIINIKVTTSERTRSVVRFGESIDSLLQSATSADWATSYYVPLGSSTSGYIKNKEYYYIVEAIDAAGNKTTSDVQTFSTKTVKLILTITGKDKKPFAYTDIIVNGMDFKTDGNGVAIVQDILPGIAAVSVKLDGSAQYFGDITVVKGDSTQAFSVSPDEIEQQNALLMTFPLLRVGTFAAITLATLAAGALAVRIILKMRAARQATNLHATNPWSNPATNAPVANLPSSAPSANSAQQYAYRTPTPPDIQSAPPYAPETVFTPQLPPQNQSDPSDSDSEPRNNEAA